MIYTKNKLLNELKISSEKLHEPSPYEDIRKMQNDYKEQFSNLKEWEIFNADFSQFCSLIEGTLSYVIQDNISDIPKKQIEYLKFGFFEFFKMYAFCEDIICNYENLYKEYSYHEQARKLLLDYFNLSGNNVE